MDIYQTEWKRYSSYVLKFCEETTKVELSLNEDDGDFEIFFKATNMSLLVCVVFDQNLKQFYMQLYGDTLKEHWRSRYLLNDDALMWKRELRHQLALLQQENQND